MTWPPELVVAILAVLFVVMTAAIALGNEI